MVISGSGAPSKAPNDLNLSSPVKAFYVDEDAGDLYKYEFGSWKKINSGSSNNADLTALETKTSKLSDDGSSYTGAVYNATGGVKPQIAPDLLGLTATLGQVVNQVNRITNLLESAGVLVDSPFG